MPKSAPMPFSRHPRPPCSGFASVMEYPERFSRIWEGEGEAEGSSRTRRLAE